jgi:hypothetical protein
VDLGAYDSNSKSDDTIHSINEETDSLADDQAQNGAQVGFN